MEIKLDGARGAKRKFDLDPAYRRMIKGKNPHVIRREPAAGKAPRAVNKNTT